MKDYVPTGKPRGRIPSHKNKKKNYIEDEKENVVEKRSRSSRRTRRQEVKDDEHSEESTDYDEKRGAHLRVPDQTI